MAEKQELKYVTEEYMKQIMKEYAASERIGGIKVYDKIEKLYFKSKFGGYRDKALEAVKEKYGEDGEIVFLGVEREDLEHPGAVWDHWGMDDLFDVDPELEEAYENSKEDIFRNVTKSLK